MFRCKLAIVTGPLVATPALFKSSRAFLHEKQPIVYIHTVSFELNMRTFRTNKLPLRPTYTTGVVAN
jgi:hypothetical protein